MNPTRAEQLRTRCSRCDRHLVVAVFYAGDRICDTWGGMVFDDETVCDCCLGECPEGCARRPKRAVQ